MGRQAREPHGTTSHYKTYRKTLPAAPARAKAPSRGARRPHAGGRPGRAPARRARPRRPGWATAALPPASAPAAALLVEWMGTVRRHVHGGGAASCAGPPARLNSGVGMPERFTSYEPCGAHQPVRPDRMQQEGAQTASCRALSGRAGQGARLGVGRLGQRRVRLEAALAAVVVLGAAADRQRRQASRHLQARETVQKRRARGRAWQRPCCCLHPVASGRQSNCACLQRCGAWRVAVHTSSALLSQPLLQALLHAAITACAS